MKMFVINLVRALRLPFITASALPYIFGSLAGSHDQNIPVFFLGLFAVISLHLSANLINDYADSRSKVDWHDRHFYGFFGGSKLIQEGIFTELFYFRLALFFAILCACAIIALAVILKSIFIILIFAAILFMAWSYSVKPLQLSYKRLGEIVIFVLFGPATVMGGYFLQSGIFPDLESFMLSVPFGFFTTAILYSNEVPGAEDDKRSDKMTWVSMVGRGRAYILYCVLIAFAFLFIILNVVLRFMPPTALFSLLTVFLAARAAVILKKHPDDKMMLMGSSRLTILAQSVASLILIMGVTAWLR